MHRQGMKYYKATAESVDFERRLVTCRPDVGHLASKSEDFTIEYDKLVLAPGCEIQTFGTPGAKEHALFLRTTNDARIVSNHT